MRARRRTRRRRGGDRRHQARIADLGREAAQLDIRVGEAIHANNEAVGPAGGRPDLLAATRGELAGARRDLDRSRELLAHRVVALYVNQPPSFVELLLSTGSLQQAQQAGELLDEVARGRRRGGGRRSGPPARLEALEEAQAGSGGDPPPRARAPPTTGAPRSRAARRAAGSCWPTRRRS